MATGRDLDKDFIEDYLGDRGQVFDSGDITSDVDFEEEIPDWEDYVDPKCEFEWLEALDGVATYQPNSRSPARASGYCRAFLVRRRSIMDTFWDDMEEPEHQLAELAFELFDRFGCLKLEFKEHPIKKGSGVWGDELNSGDILLIQTLEVPKQDRRRGIGSRLIRAVLELASKKSTGFIAVAAPSIAENELGWVPPEQSAEGDEAARQAISRVFWRKLQFRRIGYSRWFGYSPDELHASRSVAIGEDFDLPRYQKVSATPEVESLLRDIAGIDDTQCLDRLQTVFGDAAPGDTRWEGTDNEGNTLLHLVACSFYDRSIHWILQRNDELTSRRNWEGNTPLEALEKLMEEKRGINQRMFARNDISDLFTGFTDATLSCFAQLKGLDINRISEAELLRLKFGCTCGGCLGGFLSPRSREVLLQAAEITFDLIYTSGDQSDGEWWCYENQTLFEYLPETITQSLSTRKGLRTGFCMLWDYLATCLRKGIMPTEENVLSLVRNASEWPPLTRDFILRGGSISSVATMLFKQAMEMEELIPSTLPICRNDREFGMASGMCGYERVTRVVHCTMRGRKIRQ